MAIGRGSWMACCVGLVVLAVAITGGALKVEAEASTERASYELVEFPLSPPPPNAEAIVRDASAEAGVSAATVFGPDDRVRVTDTRQTPFRTIAHLALFEYGNQLSGHCSGVMLAPDVVLTAAHCVYESGHYMDSVLVIPGENWPDWPYGTGFAVKMAVPVGWAQGPGQLPATAPLPPTAYDWAILVLNLRDWGDNALAPYPVVAHASDSYFARDDIFLASAGFPGDKPSGTMWTEVSENLYVDGDALYTDLDIMPGQSGSPIFAVDSEHAFIFSVVSAGNDYFNRSVRFTPPVLLALEQYARNLGSRLVTYVVPHGAPAPTATARPSATPTPTATPTRSATPKAPTSSPTATASATSTPHAGNPRPYRLITQLLSRD